MVKFFDHWKYECGEVHVAHTDRFRMGTGLEDDRIVLRERVIDEHGEPIEDSEWWHSAQFAVREEVFKLLLGRESHMVGHEYVFEAVEIYDAAGWEHGHHEMLIDLHDHDLGQLFSGVWSV